MHFSFAMKEVDSAFEKNKVKSDRIYVLFPGLNRVGHKSVI